MKRTDKLLKGLDAVTYKDAILFCFPFAGGGSAAYNSWIAKMAPDVKVCPVQLPGREEQIMEAPYTDMGQLTEDLLDAMRPYRNQEILLFGHSMGAKIAYETAKGLEQMGKDVKLLVVSGCAAPHIPEPNPIYHLPEEEFIDALRAYDGTPEQILNNRELLKFFLPMLRADFALSESYCAKYIEPVSCPILAMGGYEDKEAGESVMKEWAAYTTNQFKCQMFHGNHFYFKEWEEEVLEEIRRTFDIEEALVG